MDSNPLAFDKNRCGYPQATVPACPNRLTEPIIFAELYEMMLIVAMIAFLNAWMVYSVIDAFIKSDPDKYEELFSTTKNIILFILIFAGILFITGLIFYLIHRQIRNNA